MTAKTTDAGLRPGEITVPLPAATDAGLYFIGRIRTPWTTRKDCPKNTREARERGTICTIEVDPRWAQALAGVETCSHLIVLYWMDQARRDQVVRRPAHYDTGRATFALRSSMRPEPIALAVVELRKVAGTRTEVVEPRRLDYPLLDLKPYFASTDAIPTPRSVGARKQSANHPIQAIQGSIAGFEPARPPPTNGQIKGLHDLFAPYRLDRRSVVAALSATSAAPPLSLFPFERPQAPQVRLRPGRDRGSGRAPQRFKRQVVSYPTQEAPGTVVVDTPNTIYLVLGGGRAIRYGTVLAARGLHLGRRQTSKRGRVAGWHPPQEMRASAYLPRFMAGGPGDRSARAPCIVGLGVPSTAPTRRDHRPARVVRLHPPDGKRCRISTAA